MDINQTCDRTN